MKRLKLRQSLALLVICLLPALMHCIKIGVSKSDGSSNSTTTTTTTTTTELPPTTTSAVNYLDVNTTGSSLPETASTPSQTFPPKRKSTSKPRPTTKPTPRPTTVATAETASTLAPTNSSNATSLGIAAPHPSQVDRFYYCACDLHPDLCEINCCCDRDCSLQALQVFHCLPVQHIRLEDFQYSHGLPTCRIHDGWLCVFRSNTKPAQVKISKHVLDVGQYDKWPDQLATFETLSPSTQQATHYKYGEALQLWHPESKQISNWELPVAYETASCGLQQPLLYLQPMQSHCLIEDASQLQTQLWTLLNLTSSHLLLVRPKDVAEQDVHGIEIQVCQQLLLQSVPQCLERNETQLDLLVDRIELQLWHNYTQILEAKLLLREANVEYQEEKADEEKELWLSYALVYKSVNELQPKPSSGPLGYVLGAPVLLAQLQSGDSSETDRLSYYQTNATGHLLMPCSTSSEQRDAIGFGVDLSRQCQVNQLAPVLPEHSNHTDYCLQLQVAIWRKLLPPNCTQLEQLDQVFISQLGRPQPDKWLPLQLSYADRQHLAPIQGFYDELDQTLSCRNMWLSVHYEFYVDELTLLAGQAPRQNVVQQARLVLGQRHDLEFDAGEQQVKLPLAVTVMFFKPQERRRNAASSLVLPQAVLMLTSLLINGYRN